jgi:methanogen extracellular protein (TIGR04279 family)
MRPAVLMFIIFCVSAAYAENYNNYTLPAYSSKSGSWLTLEGANDILMPHINLNMPEGNWTYPYDYYPVYTRNQNISGTFFGTSRMAGSTIGVTVLKLNTSSFQEALRELYKLEALEKVEPAGFTSISLNRTGIGHFSIPHLASGLYALLVVDIKKRSVLSALPMLVTDDQISVESPDKAAKGEPLKVKIDVLQGQRNISRKFGAAIVTWETYRATRINTDSNGSKEGMTSTINIGNESLKIVGEPKISQGMVDQILPILPQDSALALA